MKKTFFAVIGIISSTFLLSACTGEFEEDFSNILKENDLKNVVIKGSVTSESKHHVLWIYESSSYLDLSSYLFEDEKRKDIPGAKVYVEIDGHKYYYQEISYTTIDAYNPGNTFKHIRYESVDSFAGIPNQEHKLVVEIKGETYTAIDVMPKASNVSLTEAFVPYIKISSEIRDGENYTDTFVITPRYFFGQQEACIMMWQNSTSAFYFRQLESPQVMGDAFNLYYDEIDRSSWAKTPIKVKKMSCSPAYEAYKYSYFKTVNCNNSDFGDVASNLPTNLTNGAVGFFSAHDVSPTLEYTFQELKQMALSANRIIEEEISED